MNLKNKIVLITGASAGIGLACAEEFAKVGAKLILLARRKSILDEISTQLNKDHKVDIITYQCDVQNYSEVESVINNLPEEWINIDILINNAGLARGMSKIQDGILLDWEEMIDTNIKGLLYMSRLVLPGMVARNSGMVINIASIAGSQVYPMGNVYCATKSAVKALSQSMMIDLNGSNVRVCNVDPGMVETEFSLVRFRGDAERAEKVYQTFKPLNGTDVAEIVVFAASRPQHVTMQEIMVTPTDQASVNVVNRK